MPLSKIFLSIALSLCLTESANAMEWLREKFMGKFRTTNKAMSSKTPTEMPSKNIEKLNSLLIGAARRGSLADVKSALKSAHPLDATDEEGNTIFHLAVELNHLEILAYLLEGNPYGLGDRTCKLGVLKRNNKGQTPLHIAARLGRIEALKLILETGFAQVDSQDEDLHTPLHEAVRHRRLKAVQQLILVGANIHLENTRQETPYEMVLQSSIQDLVSAQMINLLLKKGPSQLEGKDADGDTVLHWAVKNGYLLPLKAFLRHATKDFLKKENRAKKTAKDLAKQQNPKDRPGEKCLLHEAFGESMKDASEFTLPLLLSQVSEGGPEMIPGHVEDVLAPYQPSDPFDAPSASGWKPIKITQANRSYKAIKIVIAGIITAIGGKLMYDYFKSIFLESGSPSE